MCIYSVLTHEIMLVASLVNVFYVEWSTECLKGLSKEVDSLSPHATRRNSIYFCYEDVKACKECPALLKHSQKDKKYLIWGGLKNGNTGYFLK